ncbi:MAG: alpha/beta hydrolase [Alteromonadaceae bacterium]|nr:alpha/beta hydrolase [Alteromonadaceae bacterium]
MKKFLLLFLFVYPFFAVGASDSIEIGAIKELQSELLGEKRSLQIHLPASYQDGSGHYPVLYLTDGPSHFNHTVGTMQFLARNNRMPEMIIVGVSNTDRTRDLTPSVAKENFNENLRTAGGADNFVAFFEQELIPHIEKEYRTQPYRVFSGHSFGGLFAIHIFLTKPELFNAYISVSPSLWWDAERLIKEAPEFFEGKKQFEKSLFISMAAEGDRMLVPYNKFLDVVKAQSITGFNWEAKYFDDEDHGSTVLRSQYFGLLHAWDGWNMPREAMDKGLSAVQEHYKTISERFGFKIQVPEARINVLGYIALGDNKLKEAIKIVTTQHLI